MKKHSYLGMTALMVALLSLTACDKVAGDSQSNTTTTNEQSTQQTTSALPDNAQVYTVGVDASYPPYDFRDEYGNAIGFDVDIIKAVGEKQGFGVNVIAKDWDGLVAEFDKGLHDISISGYSVTDEREQKYLVSRPYSLAQDIAISKRGNAAAGKITSIEQLKTMRVAVQGNSPYEEQLAGYGVKNMVLKDSSFLAFQSVARDEADVMIVDKGVAQYYVQQVNGSGVKLDFDLHEPAHEDFEKYELVILTPKGKDELMGKINQGITDIIKDGTYAKIYKKWFGVEPTAQDIPKI